MVRPEDVHVFGVFHVSWMRASNSLTCPPGATLPLEVAARALVKSPVFLLPWRSVFDQEFRTNTQVAVASAQVSVSVNDGLKMIAP